MLNLFKNSQPVSYVLVPAFLALVWLAGWLGGSSVIMTNPKPLYALLLKFVILLPSWFPALLGIALVTTQAVNLNYLVGRHEVLYKKSYLPALFFIIFASIIPSFTSFQPVLIVNTILIFVIEKLFRLYKSASPLPLIFDACFLIATASLIYLPAIAFVLLFIISVLILKTFAWRDWFVGLLGLMLPYFFMALFYFLVFDLDLFFRELMPGNILTMWETEAIILKGYTVTIIVVLFVFLITINKIRVNFYKNATRIRNFQQVIFIFMVVAIITLALTPSYGSYRFSILAIPLAVIISYYFLASKQSWWNEVLFWSLIATLTFNYISVLI